MVLPVKLSDETREVFTVFVANRDLLRNHQFALLMTLANVALATAM